MNLVTAIPIYRNHFQKKEMFFTTQNFYIGSIVIIPFAKTKKPALIIEINNLKEKKFLLRKKNLKINKLNSDLEIPLIKKELLEVIVNESQRQNHLIEDSFQKIFSKKIIKEINQIKSLKSDLKLTKKFVKKLDFHSVRKKLIKPQKEEIKKPPTKGKEVETIKTILSQERISKKTLHSEKHYLVDEIRNYFGETTQKGKGSFSFYLGFFKRVPKEVIYQYWSEVKQSKKPIYKQQKIFWWKIGQYLKK